MQVGSRKHVERDDPVASSTHSQHRTCVKRVWRRIALDFEKSAPTRGVVFAAPLRRYLGGADGGRHPTQVCTFECDIWESGNVSYETSVS